MTIGVAKLNPRKSTSMSASAAIRKTGKILNWLIYGLSWLIPKIKPSEPQAGLKSS
jgi:hypothetical protein